MPSQLVVSIFAKWPHCPWYLIKFLNGIFLRSLYVSEQSWSDIIKRHNLKVKISTLMWQKMEKGATAGKMSRQEKRGKQKQMMQGEPSNPRSVRISFPNAGKNRGFRAKCRQIGMSFTLGDLKVTEKCARTGKDPLTLPRFVQFMSHQVIFMLKVT